MKDWQEAIAPGARRAHGGSDAGGVPLWDFSTCANAAGPCPQALAAVQAADLTRYPDPTSTAVRNALAELHRVEPWRVLPAVSASEFIQRITTVSGRLWPGAVGVPRHAYGDYAFAAAAANRPACIHDVMVGCDHDAHMVDEAHAFDDQVTLVWHADPCSPFGSDGIAPGASIDRVPTVLDAVYAPLRLHGASPWTPSSCDAVFVLHSPNKALGLVGVRGAYAIAPCSAAYDVQACCAALEAAAPSWPLSSQADAMLLAWADARVRAWVAGSHGLLAAWKTELQRQLVTKGFVVHDSVTPFFVVRPPPGVDACMLRDRGIAVRDTSSFGVPGCWRIAVQSPTAQRALLRALDHIDRDRRSVVAWGKS